MLEIKERKGHLWIMGTLDGQRVRKATGYAVGAERAAREKLREKEKEILEGKKAGPTVKEAVAEYLARVEGIGRTSETYCLQFAAKYGRKRLRDVDTGKLYKDMAASGKARNTIRREIGAIQAMMNWSADLNRMDVSFKLKKPGKGEERLRFLEHDEKKAIIEAAPQWFKPLVVTLFYAGLRRGEAIKLCWRTNADPMGGIVKGDHMLVPTRKGRTGKIRWRTIELHPEVVKALGTPGKPGEKVFKAPNGGPLNDPTLVNKTWSAAAKLARVVDTVPHDARRTFASDLLDAGVDLRTIADLLGHTKLDLLMLYAQVRGANRKRSVAMLPGI